MNISQVARRRIKRLLARHHGAYRWTRRACMFARYLSGHPHEADFAAFRLFPHRNGLFLDVGANSGESVLSFRLFNRTSAVLSIEPNRYHEPDLRFLKRWVDGFDYRLYAAGDRNGTATMYVPVFRDLPLTGEASFCQDEATENFWVREQVGEGRADAVRLVALSVEVQRLDELMLTPAFIKIDVQGFESRVVAGLRRTILESQPVLLLERSGCNPALQRELAEMEYAACVYVPGAGTFETYREQPAQNLFFLPRREAQVRGLTSRTPARSTGS